MSCLKPHDLYMVQARVGVDSPYLRASQVVLMVKNPPANAGDIRDVGSISGLGRSPREGNGNPLQYSCLGNPMDRGTWWVTVHGVAKSQTRLEHGHSSHYFRHNKDESEVKVTQS